MNDPHSSIEQDGDVGSTDLDFGDHRSDALRSGTRHAPLRSLPSVSKLLTTSAVKQLVDQHGHRRVVAAIRDELARLRQRLLDTPGDAPAIKHHVQADAIASRLQQRLAARAKTVQLRPVINATGILLHTGLGRAPLAPQATEAILQIAAGYANVELDLASGARGQRVRVVSDLLCELTGAEAALVVNNNAAATILVLAVMASGREVIVSRGELIEIGGHFRLPEIMAASGAILREVGTTNKTRLSDYARAIGEQTAALMLVHPSNYAVVGFTQSVPLTQLVELAGERDLPVIHDSGSGAMIDFAPLGFSDEPLASRSIEQGADVVLFSGDKLLGGPQCGIILGKRKSIRAMSGHPLARALRVDKLTLAALAATLELYRDPQQVVETVPLLRLLSVPLDQLRCRAASIAAAVHSALVVERAEVIGQHSFLGGGSVPTQQLATVCVAITPRATSANSMAAALRAHRPAIVGRIRQDRLLLDLRTVFPAQDGDLIRALHDIPA